MKLKRTMERDMMKRVTFFSGINYMQSTSRIFRQVDKTYRRFLFSHMDDT
jgi:hypothetical protein